MNTPEVRKLNDSLVMEADGTGAIQMEAQGVDLQIAAGHAAVVYWRSGQIVWKCFRTLSIIR